MRKVYLTMAIVMTMFVAGCSSKQETAEMGADTTTEAVSSEVTQEVTEEKETEDITTEDKTKDLTSNKKDDVDSTSESQLGNLYLTAYEEVYRNNYDSDYTSFQLDLGFEYPVLCVGKKDYYCEFWYYDKKTQSCVQATERLGEGTWGRTTSYIPGQNILIQTGNGQDENGNPYTWKETYELRMNEESGQLELNYMESTNDDDDAGMISIWNAVN